MPYHNISGIVMEKATVFFCQSTRLSDTRISLINCYSTDLYLLHNNDIC